MSATVVLPDQLAPALAERVHRLLAQVRTTTTPRPPHARRDDRAAPRCSVCHQGGPLGGHHEPDGSVVWIHRSCHRRLHARHRGPRGPRRRP